MSEKQSDLKGQIGRQIENAEHELKDLEAEAGYTLMNLWLGIIDGLTLRPFFAALGLRIFSEHRFFRTLVVLAAATTCCQQTGCSQAIIDYLNK